MTVSSANRGADLIARRPSTGRQGNVHGYLITTLFTQSESMILPVVRAGSLRLAWLDLLIIISGVRAE